MARLIENADQMSAAEIDKLGMKAKKRIADAYSWEFIAGRYEDVFLLK